MSWQEDPIVKESSPQSSWQNDPIDEFETFKLQREKDRQIPFTSKVIDGVGNVLGTIGSGVGEYAGELASKPLETIARTPSTAIEAIKKGTIDLTNIPLMAAPYLSDVIQRPSRTQEEADLADFNREKWNERLAQSREDFSQTYGALPKASEALSYVLDPATIASFGAGAIPKQAAKAAALKSGAKVAELAEATGKGAGNMLLQPKPVLEAISKETKGSLLPAITKGAEAGLESVAAPPILLGQASEFVKESLQKGVKPSQMPILEQIANDVGVSPIVRRTANLLSKTPIEPVLNTSADFAKGALTGSVVGGGIALATGQDVGAGIGSGGTIGGIGYIGGKLASKGERFKMAQKADRDAFVERHKSDVGFSGVDLSKIPKDQLQKAADLELMGHGQFEIRFADGNTYTKLNPISSKGFIAEGANGVDRIVINSDNLKRGDDTVAHEVGHAIYRSKIADKGNIRNIFDSSYGEASIKSLEERYAKKFLPPNATPEQVQSKLKEIRDVSGNDFIYSELFSEHFSSLNKNKTFAELGKRGIPLEYSVRKFLDGTRTFLEPLGIAFKPDGSVDSSLFGKNVLSRDPKIREMVNSYTKSLKDFREGLSKLQTKDVEISLTPKQLAQDNRFALKPNEMSNDYFFRVGDTVYIKDSKQRAKEMNARRQVVLGIADQLLNEPISTDYSVFAPRRQANGAKVIEGKNINDALTRFPQLKNVYSLEHLQNMAILQEAMNKGESIETLYRKVNEKGGNVPVGFYEVVPTGWLISKADQLSVRTIKLDALRKSLYNMASNGKLDDLFGGSAKQALDDLQQMVKDHRSGKSGSSTIGDAKYQFFRGLFGDNKSNPELFNNDKSKFYRTMRVDRFTEPKQTGDLSYGFDREKMVKNMRPNSRFEDLQFPEDFNKMDYASKVKFAQQLFENKLSKQEEAVAFNALNSVYGAKNNPQGMFSKQNMTTGINALDLLNKKHSNSQSFNIVSKNIDTANGSRYYKINNEGNSFLVRIANHEQKADRSGMLGDSYGEEFLYNKGGEINVVLPENVKTEKQAKEIIRKVLELVKPTLSSEKIGDVKYLNSHTVFLDKNGNLIKIETDD